MLEGEPLMMRGLFLTDDPKTAVVERILEEEVEY